jgi:hypothetical protein
LSLLSNVNKEGLAGKTPAEVCGIKIEGKINGLL